MTTTAHTTTITTDTSSAAQLGFTTDRGSLVEALTTVGLSVSKRPALPVLGGVLLHARDGHLTVSATDYETSVSVRLPGTVQQPGTLLVDHAELTKLLAALVKGTRKREADALPVTVRTTDDDTPVVDLAEYTMPVTSYPTADYPTIPNAGDTAPTLAHVDRATFTESMGRVLVAVGTDDYLPMLTGMHVEITPGWVTLAGTDRYRLAVAAVGAVAAVKATQTTRTVSALVPARLVAPAVARFSGDRIRIGLDNVTDPSVVSFACADITVTVRTLCADNFPTYRHLLPDSAAGTIQTDRAALLAATRRAAAVLDAKCNRHQSDRANQDKPNSVAVTVTGESVSVVPVLDDHADTVTAPTQPATVSGITDTTHVWFTAAYLADALNSFTGDTITMHTQTSPTRPVLLTDTRTDSPIRRRSAT